MDRIRKIAFITGVLLLIIFSMIFVSLKPVLAQTYSVQITLGSGSGQSCVASSNCYNPDSVTVSSGTTVTWTNRDDVRHTVTSGHSTDNQTGTIFGSSLIVSGGTFSFTFKTPGTYPYFCSVHPWMTGQIVAVSLTSPSAPTALTAAPLSSSKIDLRWNTPNNGGSPITGYMIGRTTNGGTTWSTIVPNTGSNATTYSDTGLVHSTTYAYRVSAINEIGTSSPSETALATTFNVVPSPPLSLTANTGSSSQINLSWNAPSDNGGSPITDYIVEFRQSGTTTFTQIDTHSTSLTYTVADLTNDISYDFDVAAVNAAGTGPAQETSASPTSLAPQVPTSATVIIDQKVYSWTDRVRITVVAPGHNLNPNLIDTIGNHGNDQVQVCTREQCIPYQLEETGPNTGIFSGYVTLTGDPTIKGFIGIDGSGQNPTGVTSECNPICGPYDGNLAAEDLDGIRVSFVNVNGQTPVTNSSLIRWNIGEVKWLQQNYPLNGQGILQIVDPDMNLNPDAIDSFTTKVWSSSDPAGTEITMDETGKDTGIFQGKVVFSTSSISSGNMLQVNDGDNVTGQYIDRTLPQPYTSKDQLLLTATTLVGTVPVPPKFDFNVSINPQTLEIEPGLPANSTVSVDTINGIAQPVSLSCSLQSSGQCEINPQVLTPSNSATLTVTLDKSSKAGNYTGFVTGSSNGQSHETEFLIVIKQTNQPPIAKITPQESTQVQVNSPVQFSATNSYAVSGVITSYVWDFGDSQSDQGATVTHTYQNNGPYTVTLTVTDSNGLQSKDTVYITANVPPPPPPSIPLWVPLVLGGTAVAGIGIAIATKMAATKAASTVIKSALHPSQSQQPTDQKTTSHSTPIPKIEIEFKVGIEGRDQDMPSTEISDKVGKDLGLVFGGIIKENDWLGKLQGIHTVMDWYDKNAPVFDKLTQDEIYKISDATNVLNLAREAKKGRDAFFSKLSNIVIDKIMSQVSIPFVTTMIDEIKIKTKGKKKTLTFNMNFNGSALKPYIEFILKIGGRIVQSAKIVFKIDINTSMKEINFEYGKDSSTIGLGKLEVDLTVSANFTIPHTGIQESKQLGSKSFDIDLSNFHITW